MSSGFFQNIGIWSGVGPIFQGNTKTKHDPERVILQVAFLFLDHIPYNIDFMGKCPWVAKRKSFRVPPSTAAFWFPTPDAPIPPSPSLILIRARLACLTKQGRTTTIKKPPTIHPAGSLPFDY